MWIGSPNSVGPLQPKLDEALKEFQHTNLVRRLWSKDPTVWHHDPVHHEDIRNALGWLKITEF